jgi:hypothetical protein
MTTSDVRKSQLVSVVSIVGLLGLAYWLDTVTISWRRQAHAEFNMQPFLLFYVMLPVIFAILAVFLSWILLVHFKPTWLTVILCLLIGIHFVVSAISIVFPNPALAAIVNNPSLAFINRGFLEIGVGSMVVQLEAFLLVIGVINLVRIFRSPLPKSQ